MSFLSNDGINRPRYDKTHWQEKPSITGRKRPRSPSSSDEESPIENISKKALQKPMDSPSILKKLDRDSSSPLREKKRVRIQKEVTFCEFDSIDPPSEMNQEKEKSIMPLNKKARHFTQHENPMEAKSGNPIEEAELQRFKAILQKVNEELNIDLNIDEPNTAELEEVIEAIFEWHEFEPDETDPNAEFIKEDLCLIIKLAHYISDKDIQQNVLEKCTEMMKNRIEQILKPHEWALQPFKNEGKERKAAKKIKHDVRLALKLARNIPDNAVQCEMVKKCNLYPRLIKFKWAPPELTS